MSLLSNSYPASLKIEYPKKLNRLTTFFRLFTIIPILVILVVLTGSGGSSDFSGLMGDDTKVADDERTLSEIINQTTVTNGAELDGETTEVTGDAISSEITSAGLGIAGGLFLATLLMILFRQRYPRWWFDFNLELQRFTTRVGAYAFLLTDKYPSTVDAQAVHLDIKYPDAKKDLNRWLPLVKWLLAIPHYIVLIFLGILALFAVIIAWFAILFTGRYPEGLFNFVVGMMRWNLRVSAYAIFLTTDQYPPFSLK